jgi:hypothetical protein
MAVGMPVAYSLRATAGAYRHLRSPGVLITPKEQGKCHCCELAGGWVGSTNNEGWQGADLDPRWRVPCGCVGTNAPGSLLSPRLEGWQGLRSAPVRGTNVPRLFTFPNRGLAGGLNQPPARGRGGVPRLFTFSPACWWSLAPDSWRHQLGFDSETVARVGVYSYEGEGCQVQDREV